jgi:hypothetical protein
LLSSLLPNGACPSVPEPCTDGEKGKRLVLAYLAEFKDKLVVFRTNNLPYQTEGKGPRLKPEKRNKNILKQKSQVP